MRLALRFDSDGALNDAVRNPVDVAGRVLRLRSAEDIRDLAQEDAEGTMVFLDFDVIDPSATAEGVGAELVAALVQKQVAGLVLVVAGGHGESAQDGTFLEDLALTEGTPMLNARLEDPAPAGIDS